MIQISKLILAVTEEHEIHVWRDVNLSAEGALVDQSLRVDSVMFQRRPSLCVAILTKLFQQITDRN